MSMVENGLDSVLPELILRRVPYRIVTRPLTDPASRGTRFWRCRDKRNQLPWR